MSATEEMLVELAQARAKIEYWTKRKAEVEGELADYMQKRGRKSISASMGGYLFKATYTQQSNVKVDELGLRKKLGAKIFDRYTKRVLDRKRLEEAIESGAIDPVQVSPYVTTNQSVPFIRFTMKEDNEEEPDGD